MSTLHSILIIDNDVTTRSAMDHLIARCRRPIELSAAAVTRREGLKQLESDTPPQVVILEVQSIAQGVRDVSAILTANSQTMIMATSGEKRPDWIRTLIRAGASEYLTTPISADGLEETLERAALMLEQKNGAEDAGGKVITVYNPAGGMGTTTIAVNLAAALAMEGRMTALVDLNPFSSDVSAFLNLNPAETLNALRETGRRLSAGRLLDLMTRHGSGVQVLCGPEEPGVIVEFAPDQILSLITLMRGQFGVTVIDAGGELSERNLEIFDGSDVILYPLLLTLPALNNAKRYMKALNQQGFDPGRIKVVVNRYLSLDSINVSHAEEFLDKEIFHLIPNSYLELKKSIYKGAPLVTDYPRSPVTKALIELAERLLKEMSVGSH